MNSWIKHPFRVTGRLFWIAVELLLATLLFPWPAAFRSEAPRTRARWLHRTAARLLRVFRVQPQITGPIPRHGLLVSNHLSYFDVLVFGSLMPVVFVAKHEVKHWPVFGWFARVGGTIFVDRERRTQTREASDAIEATLASGVLVVLFPEGTSSGGETVLPFRSSLLEPATHRRHVLSVARLAYALDDGDPVEEVCYWKDMHLLSHMLNLLSKQRVCVSVTFAPVPAPSEDRKELAQQLHARVLRLPG